MPSIPGQACRDTKQQDHTEMENLTESYPVVIEIPVVWGEMDAFQHVNNVVYFRYFESARIAYFGKLDVMDLMNRTGIGPILASTSCRFRTPLTYPDKILIGAKVTNIEQDRFMMNYLVVSTRLQKAAAEGDGLIVAFNYRENKKAIIPDELKQRILDLEKIIS
ncbi:MAG: thioesterase family protein [Candidatus Paceibacterota bacterium]